jgi:hypothetical protein
MTFYRVILTVNHGEHAGYEWQATQRLANTFARDWRKDPGKTALVEKVTITNTRVGVLDALRRYADHPDNG